MGSTSWCKAAPSLLCAQPGDSKRLPPFIPRELSHPVSHFLATRSVMPRGMDPAAWWWLGQESAHSRHRGLTALRASIDPGLWNILNQEQWFALSIP